MNLDAILHKRYATKKFDPDFKLSTETISEIKALLRWSPSSVNSQPWHFFIAQSAESKTHLAESASGHYSANHAKILDASLVVVFCAKTELSDDYLEQILAQEVQDGRLPTPESQAMVRKTRAFYADLHRQELQDTTCWMQKQVYLNLGQFLLGIGTLELDAVPIEGVDLPLLSNQLKLAEQNLTPLALVAVGKAAKDDFNAQLPKSRFGEDQIITEL